MRVPAAGLRWRTLGIGIGIPALLLAALLHVGFRRVGLIPPLGPLLDPVHGVWAVALQADVPEGPVRIPGVTDSTDIVFDQRGVPHVFAATVEDAARALGYLHAYHRLFQLELQTRATAGRLSEWLGERALSADREQRRLGLAWAAEAELAALDTTAEFGRVVVAYAAGVNARIAELGPRDLPFEYRILGAQPQPWDALNTFLLIERMGYTLSYVTPEFGYEALVDRFGREVADALMPVDAAIQEPIIPSRRPMPALDQMALPGAEPVEERGRGAERAAGQRGSAADDPSTPRSLGMDVRTVATGTTRSPAEDRAASNNWVVSGRRTATGYPLLSGDPHLQMTLPAVWYEAHLVVPGRLDVYGVTFPGAPAVAIGFNRDVAWSFTNTGADAIDFYAETLDDPERPGTYLLDGAWQPLASRVEEYRDQDGNVIATDTSYFTHRGPVIRRDGRALSMRWTALEGQGAISALWDIGSARSVDEWLGTMLRFRAPIQNGVVADRAGDIAALSAGRYPIRPAGGDGRMILDGSTSASDWVGDLATDRIPFARNPAQGYLASANQQPLDPRASGDYLGADWPSPWRAMRINQLLRSDSAVTVDAMRRFHTDPGSARADWFVPAFLDAVVRARRDGRADPDAIRAADLLAEWDRRYTKDNERAVLFEEAMRALQPAVWDELFGNDESWRFGYPGQDLLAALLATPDNPWWDDQQTTDVVETRDLVLGAALAAGFRAARERYGEPAGGGWRWERVRHANIWHPLRVPVLSALEIPVQGGSGTLNPSSGFGTHGASWRMVVSLGPEMAAWGVYPGGQSGNPFSRWYRDRIARWSAGELDSLPMPASPEALGDDQVSGRVRVLGATR
jgi:penicillin amidase